MDYRLQRTSIGTSDFTTAGSIGIVHNKLFDWSTYWSTRFPSNLALTVISDVKIKLDWTNNGVQDYYSIEIDRSLDGVTYSHIGGVTKNISTHNDVGLTTATKYYYRIRYRKFNSGSAYSNITNATTL